MSRFEQLALFDLPVPDQPKVLFDLYCRPCCVGKGESTYTPGWCGCACHK